MSVSNSLVTPFHNGTACVNIVMFLQNGCVCVLKDIVGEKQLLDKTYKVYFVKHICIPLHHIILFRKICNTYFTIIM